MDDKISRKRKKTRERVADISLTDLDGKPTSLKHLAGDAGVAVGFLHGTYCPACMQQLNRANRYALALGERGVKLVWLLQDKPTSISAYRLAAQPAPLFDLLADTQPSVAEQFRDTSENVPEAPEPTLVYLDSDSRLSYVEASDNPHAPLHMEELLKVIKGKQGPGSSED